ncbi:alpha/beta fold hydrolase [Methyloceanibacter superfactus]|uniref:alpha/beta fold hydrolase n=1 Tax=Methyloceanibacter superfactus TaxID=1774969 RepID=UPI00313941C2
MIPGWSQTAAQFKHQLEGLGDRYHVIALDMRGHGDSDKPSHGYRISRSSPTSSASVRERPTSPRSRPSYPGLATRGQDGRRPDA